MGEGIITPDNLEPNPKNPIIASFFRNIGYSDQLGSGVRNLFKYTKYYSGKEPEFKEGDVFRIVVPLDDSYSYDFGNSADKMPINADKMPIEDYMVGLTEQQKLIMEYIKQSGKITSARAEEILGVKQRRSREVLKELVEKGLLSKQGSYKSTVYVFEDH